ncbi:glycine zipper 2TM domain-containing protein [Tepidicella baoligensis]|uniref:glycine zipper 2TM domain-containing protein n=1 Tax=Tepidicella baoligensis TaxID=2707016 RepID=UPI0015DABCFE|nr:glycine zipper 2TM domain-containing protein [Tepidicella baoligensis]
MTLQRYLIAGLLAFTALLGAQQTAAQTQPTIQTFTVQQVTELVPGTELVFQVHDTAGATVTVTLEGSANALTLRETRAGRYEGSYTLSLRDQVKYNSPVRATMRMGSAETQAVLGQTLLTATAHQRAVAAATPTPVIDYFASQASGWTGGHEITLTVRGTPGAQATATLTGTDVRPVLKEIKPGEYTTTYTIRTRDTLNERSMASVTLALAGKTVKVDKAVGAPPVQPTLARHQNCYPRGVVQAINTVEVEGEAGLTGMVAGGVAGAVLGSQVGKGSGRTAAQILGTVGGAYAGREIEKTIKKETRYDVTVRLHNGTVQTVRHAEDPALKIGQPVKIVDGKVVAND